MGEGVVLAGTVEAGSTVTVTIEADGTTITREAQVDSRGNWTLRLEPGEVPAGEYAADVTVAATDAVGNTDEVTGSFVIDTTPPEAPLIESYTRSGSGVRKLSTSITEDTIEIHAVNAAGEVSSPGYRVTEDTEFNELSFAFDSPIPNDSHLVMTASDTSGNATSTLFVLEETGTNVVNLGNPGLSGFGIEGIDLQFAEDSSLTLTASDLEALCAHSNILTIHGGADDVVDVEGAVRTGDTQEIGGRIYDVYSFGDNGGTLIIDETITVNP